MKFSKFIVIPIIIAVLAATLQVLDQSIAKTNFFSQWSGFGWVSFQAWAMYFLAGCTIKGGIRSLIGYLVGCLASIAIISLGGWLSACVGGFWGTPLALLILVIPVISLERVPWLDFVPAIFVGAGAFFAMVTYVPGATFCKAITVEMIYCVIGLIFGYVTVLLRSRYEACCAKNCKK